MVSNPCAFSCDGPEVRPHHCKVVSSSCCELSYGYWLYPVLVGVCDRMYLFIYVVNKWTWTWMLYWAWRILYWVWRMFYWVWIILYWVWRMFYWAWRFLYWAWRILYWWSSWHSVLLVEFLTQCFIGGVPDTVFYWWSSRHSVVLSEKNVLLGLKNGVVGWYMYIVVHFAKNGCVGLEEYCIGLEECCIGLD